MIDKSFASESLDRDEKSGSSQVADANCATSLTFAPVDDEIDFVGPYRDTQLLVSTASAHIYRVSKAGKTMLLKVPADDSGRALDLLKREYRLGIGLSHPNVAAIYTWEPSTPVGPGILMEYVDGRTLAEFIAENTSLNARRRVFEQLLDAVNYIHHHGVTHNDLKPGNIMVSRVNNDVKIIDFGLSDNDGETTQRQLGGTAGYASPELSVRDRSADMRSDIYSIGVIMHDIFGERYRGIWQKCMARKPEHRYRNIDSLIKAWQWRMRRPVVISITVMALILIGAVGIVAKRIHDYRLQVEQYSEASQQLADTISALRLSQIDANDSISLLNGRLYEINRERAINDSLADAYISAATKVIEKYKAMTRRMRCVDEAFYMYRLYDAEMARCDSLFLLQNPQLGPAIYDQYGVSVKLRGANELEALVKQLPTIQTLTSDFEEQMRVIQLIYNGQPWHLHSDSVR